MLVIFLLQRLTRAGQELLNIFCIDVNDISIAENWARGDVLRPPNNFLFANDIFITENWARRNLLCPNS